MYRLYVSLNFFCLLKHAGAKSVRNIRSLCQNSGKAELKGKKENFPLGGEREFALLNMAPGVGFEPTTNWLTANCATAALPGNNVAIIAKTKGLSNKLKVL